MRLSGLEPRWLLDPSGEHRIGLMFRCPLEPANDHRWQSVFFEPTPSDQQFDSIVANMGPGCRHIVQQCKPDCGWSCEPPPAEATFDNISLRPSVDGSAGGNWHGNITNGEAIDA